MISSAGVEPKLTLSLLHGFAVMPDTAGASHEPPKEFRLFPKGKHTSEKGTFVFNSDSAKSVMERAQEKGNDIPIDYEHLMLEEGDKLPGDGPTPAAGWFNLEVREGELWAVNVRWTDRAANYLKQKEYRFMSPAFRHTKEGIIRELVNVALVNLPAQHHQSPLVAAKDDEHTPKEQPVMKHLLATLKLSESAVESEAVAVVTTLQADRKKLLDATGTKDVEEALGSIAALKQSVAELDTAKKEILTLKAADHARKVEKLVSQGVKAGKIPPAMKEQFVEQGLTKNGIKFLKGYLETAQTIVGTKGHKQPKSEKGEDAGEEASLKAIAQKVGVPYEKLKEQYQKDRS